MKHITRAMLTDVVGKTENSTFDSHEVIRLILTHYPQEYTKELYEHVHDADPILALHSVIGESLHDPALGLKATKKVKSMNIRGRENLNQEWEKV